MKRLPIAGQVILQRTPEEGGCNSGEGASLKVLLSAFACSPNAGSEPAVGWNWTLEIGRLGHEVYVVTSAGHWAAIEAYHAQASIPDNIHFAYVSIPWPWYGRSGVPKPLGLYARFWQWAAYRAARRLHKENGFNLVHHLTWGALRMPTFMACLGIPLVFGPVGGGEAAPLALRRDYSWRGWLSECARDLENVWLHLDPLLRRTCSSAARIYVTSRQSLALVPQRDRRKTIQHLAIGTSGEWLSSKDAAPVRDLDTGGATKLLFVGRLVCWKGLHLGLRAFAQALQRQADLTFTVVGSGPEGATWRALSRKLGIAEKVSWRAWVSDEELNEIYNTHHVFIFPSLHDAGGLVVLEALARALPVICLDLGGPGIIVDAGCGRVVSTGNKSRDYVVDRLADAMAEISFGGRTYHALCEGAVKRAEEFAWSRRVSFVYDDINSILAVRQGRVANEEIIGPGAEAAPQGRQ